MTPLDLDRLSEDAAWAAERASEHSVACRVLTEDVPALVAALRAVRDREALARLIDPLAFKELEIGKWKSDSAIFAFAAADRIIAAIITAVTS